MKLHTDPTTPPTTHCDESGQTMAEYGVVLGIITIAVVASIGLLSSTIVSKLGEVVTILGLVSP